MRASRLSEGVFGQQARVRRRAARHDLAAELPAQVFPLLAEQALDVVVAVQHIDAVAARAVLRKGPVQHHLDAAILPAHRFRQLPAVLPFRAVGVDQGHVRTDGHAVEFRLHGELQALARGAHVDLQHVLVDEERVRDDVVIGLGRLVEGRQALVQAARVPHAAVEDQVALDAADALVVQGAQHVFDVFAGQVGIRAALQHQVPAQDAFHHLAAGAQLGAAAEGGTEAIQADHGRDQLHGRCRLHRPVGLVGQHDRVALHDQDPELAFVQALLRQYRGHGRRQLG